MTIWVDADACPNVIKEMLFRAAERTQTALVLIANQPLRTPPSAYIRAVQVSAGFDVADNEIVRRAAHGDLVITSDIPLAAEVIEKGALVVTPRGEQLSAENVRSRLNMRDFLETLRSSGVQTGGPSALNDSDKREFANQLDRYLAKQPRVQ